MKFIISFFLFSLIFLGLLIGLVTSVDPYSKLGNNPWAFETKAVAQSRENKYILLENAMTQYEAFLLGSSAAHRFPTETVKSITGLETFNYAAQHTTPEDYLAMLRHILAKSKPKLVFLQIGFVEMDENYKTDNRLYNSSLASYLRDAKKPEVFFDNNYFTLDAIRDSLRVIYVNNWGEALHSKYTEHGNYEYEAPVEGPIKLQQSGYGDWKLSQERIQILKEIKALCEKNNIKLIVFTAPLSADHYNIAKAHPGHPIYLSVLKEIFGEFWNFHHDSIYKFSTYKEFHNSTHMTQEFSAELLRVMLGSHHSELGEYQK